MCLSLSLINLCSASLASLHIFFLQCYRYFLGIGISFGIGMTNILDTWNGLKEPLFWYFRFWPTVWLQSFTFPRFHLPFWNFFFFFFFAAKGWNETEFYEYVLDAYVLFWQTILKSASSSSSDERQSRIASSFSGSWPSGSSGWEGCLWVHATVQDFLNLT